ncbi:MAG: hypothetical protein ACREMJ_07005 [Gemmatimonadales bacterium]
MTPTPDTPHLTPDEVELWAQGLLPTARALHLADCGECLALAERERRLVLELARLPRFAPEFGFAARVLAQVKIPTPSGDYRL